MTWLPARHSPNHVAEWWTFNLLFYADETGHSRHDEFSMDLTRQPLWDALSADERAQSIDWAAAYLAADAPVSRRWIGTSSFHRPAAAAYRALRLLRSEAPERLAALPEAAWGRWVHAILAVSANEDETERAIRADLLAHAYRLAPHAFRRALARALTRVETESSLRQILERLDKAYDALIADLLWRFAQRPKIVAAVKSEIWSFLLVRGETRARRALEAELQGGGAGAALGLDKESYVRLAAALLYAAPAEGWTMLQSLGTGLARDIFLAAHVAHALGSFALAELGNDQLGDLYIWIDRESAPHPR